MQARLIRLDKGDDGTFGVLLFNGKFLHTGELPWHDNRTNVSCIPTGKHPVFMSLSPKYGRVYQIEVEGRTHVLLHHGNYCGDCDRGKRSDVRGCILLGKRRGRLGGQDVVLASRVARREFEQSMAFKPFELEII